jgi:hypothetical protein
VVGPGGEMSVNSLPNLAFATPREEITDERFNVVALDDLFGVSEPTKVISVVWPCEETPQKFLCS